LFDQKAARRSGFTELPIDVAIESQAVHIANLETGGKEPQLEVNNLRSIAKKRSKLQYSIMKPTKAGIGSSMASNAEVLDLNPLRDWLNSPEKMGRYSALPTLGPSLRSLLGLGAQS
jgi:hypothetical protein